MLSDWFKRTLGSTASQPQVRCRTLLLSLRALPSVKHVPPPHALHFVVPVFIH